MGEELSAQPSNRSSESIAATNALSQSEGPGTGSLTLDMKKSVGQSPSNRPNESIAAPPPHSEGKVPVVAAENSKHRK